MGWPDAGRLEDCAGKDLPSGVEVEVDRAQCGTVLLHVDFDPLVGAPAEHGEVVQMLFLPEYAWLKSGA